MERQPLIRGPSSEDGRFGRRRDSIQTVAERPMFRTTKALLVWVEKELCEVFPMFLALGMSPPPPPRIIILPKKLIRWEAAGSGLGQGLRRSWGRAERMSQERDRGAKQQEVAPLEGVGSSGRLEM